MMSTDKEVNPDRETVFIDKLAKKIVDSGMEGPAITLLQLVKPISVIGGELSFFYLAPFLPLLDNYGYDFLEIFEKRENIEKLIKRVENLYKEKEINMNKDKKDKILNRLKRFFQNK